ncbi:hypothetical protein [Ruminococcus sp.]|uniref:hypothetical protein n=1 Tax=Ruminococcus sp. TaxID=41978 RepID=UPI003F0B0809
MSHSKHTKRGYSIYIEKWNPSAKKYINTCVLCGCKGYSPALEQEGFCKSREQAVIFRELSRTLPRLELDERGCCADCARILEKV